MKNFFAFLFLIIALGLGSCSKNEFFIDFSLPENVEVNYDVVYYADSKKGGAWVQTVAPLLAGKFNLHGITVLPTLVYVSNHTYPIPVVIYAEKGDKINIIGEEAFPYTWKVEGNGINQRLSEWRNENAELLAKADRQLINKAVKEYVEKNQDDPVSTILLLTSFFRAEDEPLFESLLRQLSGKAGEDKWLNLVARSDQPTFALSTPARLKSVAFRKYPKGIDTLRTASSDAGLLIFWTTSLENRREFFKEIKEFSADFPDSSKRIIADICLDADSLAWRNYVRQDTLKGVARLWTPQGPADKDIMKLGVKRTPFFIVFDKEGNQKYRGAEPDSAFSSFRKLIKN